MDRRVPTLRDVTEHGDHTNLRDMIRPGIEPYLPEKNSREKKGSCVGDTFVKVFTDKRSDSAFLNMDPPKLDQSLPHAIWSLEHVG